MTVRQLLNNLDSREISEWIAYFNLQNQKDEIKKMPLDQQFKAALQSKRKKK